MRGPIALRAVQLSRHFPSLSPEQPGVTLFHQLDLQVAAGEMVAIMGRSGAGKSSLLHLLAGLDRPSSGSVWIGATELNILNADQLARFRNRAIGYVWQFHYVLPEFSALENIALPLLARGESRRSAMAKAQLWLDRVELTARAHHRSGELSGGEQQRVALARALVTDPEILLADEPTGDLDDETATTLFHLLQRLCRDQGLAALLVSHSTELASRCDRTLRLSGGQLEPLPTLP